MVVDAVLTLDQTELNINHIATKKATGGAIQDSLFIAGVAFKKTFSYAGFEQQPKSFTKPPIICLNVELELKAEKDNAEVRVEHVSDYQAIVDAEWKIIFDKCEAIYNTGAKVVLSKLPIGDLATQYFADRDVFCAGRVTSADLDRVCAATGATTLSTCTNIPSNALGTCESFEEKQIGSERYNFFTGCPEAKTCTLLLRGGAEQFIAEVERSLHDAIMVVKRALQHQSIVAGGGAAEMEISCQLHRYADVGEGVPYKQQAVIKAFAKALEVIPRLLCDNAGLDATDVLNRLRVEHAVQHNKWAGVDLSSDVAAASTTNGASSNSTLANGFTTTTPGAPSASTGGQTGVSSDLLARHVWEPALVKVNAIQAATEASCLILSVDETIRNEESEKPQGPQRGLPPGAAQRALRGRGRGMPRR